MLLKCFEYQLQLRILFLHWILGLNRVFKPLLPLTCNIKLDDGRTARVNENTVFINSRFAGTYNVVDALYYRIGVLTYDLADWPTTVDVTALNATTFKMEAPCEPFGSNSIYFTIDDASGNVQVLKTSAQPQVTHSAHSK